MKKTNLKVCESTVSYVQIYQESNVTISFLQREGKGYREMFNRVLCRDYLGDCVNSSLADSDIGRIYGFTLRERLDADELLLSVKVTNKESFLKGICIIRRLERSFGSVKPMEVLETQHPDIYVLKGTSIWQSCSLAISILTYTLRLINHPRSSNYRTLDKLMRCHLKIHSSGADARYARSIIESGVDIPLLLSHLPKILGDNPVTGICDSDAVNTRCLNNYEDNIGGRIDLEVHAPSSNLLYTLHGNSGIYAFSLGLSSMKGGEENFPSVGSLWASNYLKLENPKLLENFPVVIGDTYTRRVNGIKYKVSSYSGESDRVSLYQLNTEELQYTRSSVEDLLVEYTKT